jgi:hypothetical protein
MPTPDQSVTVSFPHPSDSDHQAGARVQFSSKELAQQHARTAWQALIDEDGAEVNNLLDEHVRASARLMHRLHQHLRIRGTPTDRESILSVLPALREV